MSVNTTIARLVDQLLESQAYPSLNAIAKDMGVTQPTLHRIYTGESKDPARQTLEKIARFFSLSVDDLYRTTRLQHAHQLTAITTWDHPDELPEGEFVHVPRLNVHPSAGNGNGEQIEVDLVRSQTQAFRADWIRRERLRPGKLASMYADGHSMEPLIQDGDSLLVDTSQHTVIDGRVYVIWYAGELRVKRLYKRVDGGLVIHSDNEREFPRLEVPVADLEHVRIIGRVVHRQGTGGL